MESYELLLGTFDLVPPLTSAYSECRPEQVLDCLYKIEVKCMSNLVRLDYSP